MKFVKVVSVLQYNRCWYLHLLVSLLVVQEQHKYEGSSSVYSQSISKCCLPCQIFLLQVVTILNNYSFLKKGLHWINKVYLSYWGHSLHNACEMQLYGESPAPSLDWILKSITDLTINTYWQPRIYTSFSDIYLGTNVNLEMF